MLEEMKIPADTRWKDACEMFSKNAIFNSADRLDQLAEFTDSAENTRQADDRRQRPILREA